MHLDWWGWLKPKVINDPSQVYEVTVGQASEFPGGDGVYRGVKIELPDGAAPLPVPVWQGKNYWWGGKGDLTNGMMTTAAPIAIPAEGASLSFDLVYDIEDQWDFLWVQASEDGTTWKTLTNANTQCTHDPVWVGGLYGFPEDLCAAGIGGFTDYNANWPEPESQVFDLAAFAGKSIWLRLWYMTDWATTYSGPFVDNVKVVAGATTLFADDAESGDAKWTYAAPWQRIPGPADLHAQLLPAVAQRERDRRLRQRSGRSALALRPGQHRLVGLVQQQLLQRQRDLQLPDRLSRASVPRARCWWSTPIPIPIAIRIWSRPATTTKAAT